MNTVTAPKETHDSLIPTLGPQEMRLERELFHLYNLVDNADQVPQSVLKRICELEAILGY